MSETLREITEEYAGILDTCYKETLITAELSEKLATTEDKWEKKLQNLVYVVQELSANCDIVANEIERLTKRLSMLKNNQKSLQEYIKSQMLAVGQNKVKTPFYSISLRKTEPIDVDPEFIDEVKNKHLDALIRVIPEKIEPNKAEIKKYINAGNRLEHARISENLSLSIR